MALIDFDPLRNKAYQSTGLGSAVAEFLAWLQLGGAAPRTLDQYERDLARGALLYPSKGVADLSDGDILQIALLFKPGERRTRMAAWQSFYKWALRSRRVMVNPCDALPDFKKPKQKVYDIFTDAETALLCGRPSPDGVLMAILLDAGLRKSEAQDFQLRHYRPDPSEAMPWGALAILSGKGDKDRLIRATRRVSSGIAELAVLDGLNDKDHLWYGVRSNRTYGRAVHSRLLRDRRPGDGTVHRWWERCLADAGVRYRNMHMARHTFATNWLRKGGRLERLSTAMGHASIRTTFDLYGHLDAGDVAADLALIEERA